MCADCDSRSDIGKDNAHRILQLGSCIRKWSREKSHSFLNTFFEETLRHSFNTTAVHKGANDRVRTDDRWYPVLVWNFQFGTGKGFSVRTGKTSKASDLY